MRGAAPGRGAGVTGEGLLGPDRHRPLRHRRAEGSASCRPILVGDRAVVPGLLWSPKRRQRLRLGQRRPGGARPRHGGVGGDRAEGVDVARPPGRLVLRALPHRGGVETTPGLPTSWCRCASPGWTSAPSCSRWTRTSEFNEVFFDGARTDAANEVGEVGDGWRVALATLAFERGVALLGHQLTFRRELDRVIETARLPGPQHGPGVPPTAGPRPTPRSASCGTTPGAAFSGVEGPVAPPEASIAKLYWASWHQRLGELTTDLLGISSTVLTGFPYESDEFQRSFLFGRSETIYGGSNEIQRNIIGERAVLGLPAEPKAGAVMSLDRILRLRRLPCRLRAGRPRVARRQGGPGDRRRRDGDRLRRPPGGAWRRGRRWSSCPTPTSGAWARRRPSLDALGRTPPAPTVFATAVPCDVTVEAAGASTFIAVVRWRPTAALRCGGAQRRAGRRPWRW